ncbi:MAG TPA: hypothetical protein VMV56_12205 [Williamwhitmania sp.]|nr:hypothetical protein [Williamwhitmania sp.]
MKSNLFKYLIFIALWLSGCATAKQKLLYNTWVRVKVEKKDGSRYVERNGMDTIQTVFEISHGHLGITYNDLSQIVYPFSFIGDSILKTYLDYYKVISVNDTSLVVLVNDNGSPDDKVNKFIFLKEKNYIDYIFTNKLVEYKNDTVVRLNKMFLPFYTGGWEYQINSHYNSSNFNGYVSMEVMLDSFGVCKQIRLVNNKDIPDEVANNILKLIKGGASWNLWKVNRKVYYQVDLTVFFISEASHKYAGVKLFSLKFDPDFVFKKSKQLAYNDILLSNKYFKEGVNYVNNSELEKAILSFSNCISIDSLYVDAYYNRAFVYYKLDQLDKSCLDWLFLDKQLGQKPAEKLFNERCIK